MKKGRGKLKKRVFAAVLSLAMILTGITWPEIIDKDIPVKVEAAGPTEYVYYDSVHDKTYTRRIDYTMIQNMFTQTKTVGGRVSNYTYEDVINRHVDTVGYENAEYVFGSDWNGTDALGRNESTFLGKTLTQGPKYKYVFNDNLNLMRPSSIPNERFTNEEILSGITQDMSNSQTTQSLSLVDKIALDRALVGEGNRGYHYYNYEVPHGTQVPIVRWEAWGNSIASHNEGNTAKAGYHSTNSSSQYPEAYYVDAGGNRKGQWAWYHGILYHGYLHNPEYTYKFPDGIHAEIDTWAFPECGDGVNYFNLIYDSQNQTVTYTGEPISPCGKAVKNSDGSYNLYWNNTAWRAICGICGQPITCNDQDMVLLWYANKNQLPILTVLEMGREVVLSCNRCGGMENQAWYSHNCQAISPNRYFVKYNPNTTDMVYGGPQPATWLTNFETNYDGKEIPDTSYINKVKRISNTGYTRPGYIFKGWAYSPTATIADFPTGGTQPSLKILQNKSHIDATDTQIRSGAVEFYENYHETTLYAVWEPEENAFSIDVDTRKGIEGNGSWKDNYANAFNPAGNVTRPSSILTNKTSKVMYQTIAVTINKDLVNYPAGTNVIFHATEYGTTTKGLKLDGNNGNPNEVEKRGPVSANNVSFASSLKGSISGLTKGNDGELTFNYQYGLGGYSAEPDVLYISYEQGPVIMPPIDPPNNTVSFIGWYDSAGNFLGMPGDSYPSPITGTMHIYPKFSTFKVDVEDVYYKTGSNFGNVLKNSDGESENGDKNAGKAPTNGDNVHYATGAANIKVSMIGNPGLNEIFQLQYKKEGGAWTDINEDGSAGTSVGSVDSGNLVNSGSEVTYTIPKTGYYTITAAGGDGVDYKNAGGTIVKTGGKGAKAHTTVFLNAGDVIKYQTGNKGGGLGSTYTDEAGNSLNGGQYTRIVLDDGTQVVELLIAGGGGAASSTDNGDNGAAREANFAGSSDDFSGHGATVSPPVAHVHHNHTLSGCTKDSNGNWTCAYPDHPGNCAYKPQVVPHVHQEWHSETDPGCYSSNHGGACYNQSCVDSGLHAYGSWEGYNHCTYWNQPTWWIKGSLICGYNEGDPEEIPGSFGGWDCTIEYDSPGTSQKGKGGDVRIVSVTGHPNFTSHPNGAEINDSADGNGYVRIQSVQLGYLTAKSGEYLFLGFTATDTTKPGAISLAYDKTANGGTVTWEAVGNPRGNANNNTGAKNSTSYYFRAVKGTLSGSGTPGSTLTTPEVRIDIVSGIAGYYYCYDNTKTTVIGESNAYKGASSYTWGDHFNNDGGNYGFVRGTSVPNVEAARGGRLYMHVAAVDVAGNVGPTSTIEFENETTTSDKWVVELIFDPNPMEYQIKPKTNIAYTTTTGLHNVSTGNVVGSRIKGGYYLYANGTTTGNDGSYATGLGTKTSNVRYGQAWPNMTNAKFDDITFSFQGWNTRPDGKGTWISQSGSGDGSGSSPANAKKFVPKDYVTEWESYKYDLGQIIAPKVRIYAIWREYASLFVQAAYQKATVNALTGAVSFEELLLGQSSQPGYPIRSLETPWSKLAVLRTAGNGYATGRDYYLLTQNGHDMRVYPTRIPGDAVSTAFMDHKITNLTSATAEVFGTDNPNETTEYWDRPFDLGFKGQGTYNVRGQIYSKQARSTPNATGNEQGAYAIGDVTNSVIRIDMTPPEIPNGTVKQRKLTDYTEEQVRAWGNGTLDLDLTTTFTVGVTDYNRSAYGPLVTESNDSSGIAGVFLKVKDLNNGGITMTYPMTRIELTNMTKDNTGVLRGVWQVSPNLYADFPKSEELDYEIFAVDRAGNVCDTVGNLSNQDDPSKNVGYILNFSVKTVIKNETNETMNFGEGVTHFFTGDYGHVDIWTVGFVADVEMDFGAVGGEMLAEMAADPSDGNLHNMGARSIDLASMRKVNYTNGYEVRPASIKVYDKVNGVWNTLTSADGATYDKALTGELMGQVMPQPYARKYTGVLSNQKWDDQGVSQRIPPAYPLSAEKYEIWNYAVFGYKGIAKTKATSTYIICEPATMDLHYRITHED